jgi:chromosome partitioning protein
MPPAAADIKPGTPTGARAEDGIRRQATIIAVGNLKGGTGKSTIAVNLGCALAASGRPTVVIDADPQLTATQWLVRRSLPATLVEAPVTDPAAPPVWLDALPELAARHAFVVLDLPSVLGTTMAAALLLADLILIPTSVSPLDLAATTRTLHRVAKAEGERRGPPPAVFIVPTRFDGGWLGEGGWRAMRRWAGQGERLTRVTAPLAPAIRRSEDFARAFDAGDWIGAYAPRSRAHRDIRRLMKAVDRRLAADRQRSPRPRSGLTKVAAAGLTA